MTAHLPAVGLEQLAQHREVVLEVVDRDRRVRRRRPAETGVPLGGGRGLEVLVVGDPAGDGAHDVERVERRDARPRLRDLDPRVREPQAFGGRADREPQQQTLGLPALRLRRQARVQRHAQVGVEHHRVFVRLLRKHAFREAGHEDDAEGAAARLLRAADEDAAVAGPRRLVLEQQQTFRDDIARLVERHRADGPHRAQIGQHLQHAVGMPEHARRQRGEAVQPLAPRCRPRATRPARR